MSCRWSETSCRWPGTSYTWSGTSCSSKAVTLSWVSQEASEAVSSVERLTEECRRLHRDLQRQEALVSQKELVIAELRDEACTLWASGWLAFRRKATMVFLGLDFNFQVPTEGEAEEFYFDDEADPMVLSNAPNSIPLPSEPNIDTLAEANSPTSVTGTSPFDLHGLEVQVTKAAQSPTSEI